MKPLAKSTLALLLHPGDAELDPVGRLAGLVVADQRGDGLRLLGLGDGARLGQDTRWPSSGTRA